MRVLIVHSNGRQEYPSGELQVLKFEEKLLRKNGISVQSYVHRPINEASWYRLLFLLSIGSSIFFSRKKYQSMLQLIDKYRPDLIHFHSIIPYLSPSVFYAARKKSVAVVQTLHNGRWLCIEGGFYRNGRYCDECIRDGGFKGVIYGCSHNRFISLILYFINILLLNKERLSMLVDRFIAVSDFVRDQHLFAGFPADKIITKNNSVDLFQLDKIRKASAAKDRVGIAFVGRISVAKGAEIVREMFSCLKYPFHIIGDGPDLEMLHAHCKRNDYQNITFWGKQSHEKCLKIMSTARCVVVPSQCGETFSLVTAEAMGLGIPVIGFDIGGLGTLLKQSGGGVVVRYADLDAFIQETKNIYENQAKARRIGTKGISYVGRYLSPEYNIQQLIDIYNMAIFSRKRTK